MGDILDAFNKAKSWYTSKTIFGIILMVIPNLIKLVKPELVVDFNGVVNDAWTTAEVIANTGDQIWAQVMEIIGTAVAIYGRTVAKFKLRA